MKQRAAARLLNNALTGVVTTMVVEVMPNGNLVVEEGSSFLTEGAEFIQVRGVLRARDIHQIIRFLQ